VVSDQLINNFYALVPDLPTPPIYPAEGRFLKGVFEWVGIAGIVVPLVFFILLVFYRAIKRIYK